MKEGDFSNSNTPSQGVDLSPHNVPDLSNGTRAINCDLSQEEFASALVRKPPPFQIAPLISSTTSCATEYRPLIIRKNAIYKSNRKGSIYDFFSPFLLPYILKDVQNTQKNPLIEELHDTLTLLFGSAVRDQRCDFSVVPKAENALFGGNKWPKADPEHEIEQTEAFQVDLSCESSKESESSANVLHIHSQTYVSEKLKEAEPGSSAIVEKGSPGDSYRRTKISSIAKTFSIRVPLPSILKKSTPRTAGDDIDELVDHYLKDLPRKLEESNCKKELSVARIGSGDEAIIMVHGICMSSSFWVDGLLRYIKPEDLKSFTFYCPDLLGYGKSSELRSQDNYSREEQVLLIFRDIILKNDLLSYHLIGHSFGGIVCLDIASRNPTAVKTMTLFAPAYFESERQAYQILTSVPFPVKHTVAYPELGRFMIKIMNRFRPWLMPVASRIIPVSEFPLISLNDFFAIDPDATIGTVATILQDRVEHCLEILERFQLRIFVAHGDKDGVVPVRQGQALAERYPNVILRVLPGMVHHFPVSHARLAADIVHHELARYAASRHKNIQQGYHTLPVELLLDETPAHLSETVFT